MSARKIGAASPRPTKIQFAPGLPKTRSGKIMRRILRKIAEDDFGALGDTSTLRRSGSRGRRPHRGRLAAARRAEQRDELAAVDREIEAVEDGVARKAAVDLAGFDCNGMEREIGFRDARGGGKIDRKDGGHRDAPIGWRCPRATA
jgi:hypothetical protein